MKAEQIQQMIEKQRKYFMAGKTLPVKSRIQALTSLKNILMVHEQDIYDALKADLGKSEAESYMCELGLVYSEITYMIKHVNCFAREKRVATPLAQFHSRSFVKPSPRGVTLIMSPWNYPVMLTLDPLVDALAAGNTAIVKPSAYAPATSEILKTIIAEAFNPALVAIVTGGHEENKQLLEQKFDYIFFTGSSAVGKEVLRCAAPNLTPVSLELGGKSPCIVDRTANIKLAARRIVFGKYLNLGQTCVAPDYLLCDELIADKLIEAVKEEIQRQFGKEPFKNKNYGKIINEKHFARLSALLDIEPILYGGKKKEDTLQIEPTILYPCDWNSKIMEDEIFGPLLPVITYTKLDEVLEKINSRPHPLAFYIFSKNKAVIKHITESCQFGGGCINDTIIHLATSNMGFGGVGNSGMGAYHGKVGFDAFSHHKSIVDKKTWIDLPMRYQPYKEVSQKLVKLFLR